MYKLPQCIDLYGALPAKKALTTFHYALNPKGFLLLGKSETTGGVPDLFAAVGKTDKLYTRKDVPGRFMQVASQRSEQILNRPHEGSKSEPNRTDFQKTADDILLTKYTPAGVVVNETMDIVHFRGNTANYLEQASGKPSHNLLTMAKSGLGFELRNILHKAKTDKVPVVKNNIPLSVNGNLRNISIEAVPLPNTLEPYYLILFHDNYLNDTDELVVSNKKKGSAKTKKDEKDIQIQLLEQELAQAREDMRSITEDQEASNEELQSANEELLSGSEELQSLNEELETSKEELQSTNEELLVLNHELVSLNEQVTDARNYSESIVSTLYQPLLVLDKNLRVKTANKAFYKTFKVNEQETEGVLIYDLGNRQWNIPKLRTLLEKILPQKKQINDFEVTHNFLSIGERVILLSALEITREKKEEKLILLSIEDITERKHALKKLEESEEKFSTLVENMENLAWLADGDGLIYWYNKRWYDYTGTTLEEMKGWGWQKVHHPDHVDRVLNFVKEAWYKNESFELTFPLLGADGEYKWFLTRAYPIADEKGKVIRWIGTNTDITEQKDASKKAEADTRMAEDALKAKQQFLSNMSHEIRTPLNAIVGFTNVVLKTKLDETQKKYIHAIKMSGDSLVVLIDDILDLAKVDAGKLILQLIPFKLSASIAAMFNLFEIKTQEKNIVLVKQYDTTIPEILLGDPARLHQILINLINNAIKFTTKGKIIVRVRLLDENDEKATIEFSITDTGIGIPENSLENIFNAFQQATSETSQLFGGTGLGLAIVKQLVELQGGTISVKSAVGKGSTFSFVMSYTKTELKIEAKTETGVTPSIENLKILVVEDIKLNQILIKIILEDFGIEVDLADNGKIAIEKIKINHYDIILMDLQMPEMNGVEATAYIRNKMNSHIPIIALTADVTTVDVEKCKAIGMNDYISKPIDEKLLYSKIIQYFPKPI